MAARFRPHGRGAGTGKPRHRAAQSCPDGGAWPRAGNHRPEPLPHVARRAVEVTRSNLALMNKMSHAPLDRRYPTILVGHMSILL